MQERKSETIDGIVFSIQQLPYRRGARLMHKLVSAAGPALFKALAGSKDSDAAATLPGIGNMDVDMGNVADGLGRLFDQFSAADFDHMVNELFETATIVQDGSEVPLLPVLDQAMAGKQGTMLKAIRFALQHNYGSFLPAFGAALRRAQPQPKGTQSKA